MEKMGFKVSLNGVAIADAGFADENYVLNSIMDAVHRPDGSTLLHLRVGGLSIDKQQHAEWLAERLHVGDSVTIEVINGPFDPPTSVRESISEAEVLQNKIKLYFQLREELKGLLIDTDTQA